MSIQADLLYMHFANRFVARANDGSEQLENRVGCPERKSRMHVQASSSERSMRVRFSWAGTNTMKFLALHAVCGAATLGMPYSGLFASPAQSRGIATTRIARPGCSTSVAMVSASQGRLMRFSSGF